MKPTDQELQKIAHDLHIAATIPLENWKGFGYPSESFREMALKSLTQVRDAQEEKLRIAREALKEIKDNNPFNIYTEVGEFIEVVDSKTHFIAKEALERMEDK